MTIKYKLNLITIIVVSFALIIIATTLKNTLTNNAIITQAQELNKLSQELSLLIHETQKERGASAGFIGSKGEQFDDILPKQRTDTTKEYVKLTTYINTLDLNAFPKELNSEIT
ncbi:MAG: nitrate- and nitrite sensing domain-containing protein, partial [Sulfurimonadaceae bacterium]